MAEVDRSRLAEDTAILHAMATTGIRIDDRRFERAVINTLSEYDRRGTEIERLKADLARARGVVDAAEELAAWFDDDRCVVDPETCERIAELAVAVKARSVSSDHT